MNGAAAFAVREAGAADLGAVEKLIAAFQAESDWRRDPPMHAATRAAIEAGRAPGARVFIAESGAEATARGSASPTSRTTDGPRDEDRHPASGNALEAARRTPREASNTRGSASPTSRTTDAIAFASTWFAWDLGDGPGTWLSDLYVVPAWRRRGVGRALVVAAAQAAREGGAVWFAWHVDHSNAASQAFYAALGAVRKPQHLLMSLPPEALARLGG